MHVLGIHVHSLIYSQIFGENMSKFSKHLLLLIFSFLSYCNGFFNFYLGKGQVSELFGVNGKLYFVKDGKVNIHAINFTLTIPWNKNTMQFNWEKLANPTVSYAISLHSSTSLAQHLILDIQPRGSMLPSTSSFRIKYPCDGTTNANFSMTVEITSEKFTNLTFRMKQIKQCLSAEVKSPESMFNEYYSHDNYFIKLFSTAMLSMLIFALFLSFFAIYPYYMNKKSSIQDVPNRRYKSYVKDGESGASGPQASILSANQITNTNNMMLLNNRCTNDLEEKISELMVERYRVRLGDAVIQGTFGRVYNAYFLNEEGNEDTVMVKTVANHASEVQISLLLQEGMAMYSLKHKNILSILGVSIQDHTAPFLLFSIENYTNLKSFLHKCKLTTEGISFSLTTKQVVEMAQQVADALQYLHKRNIIHKDVATRNCVVKNKLKIQITDSALSRDLFPADYHCLGDNENRPIKWLAFETLCHKNRFSPCSDIWSFGVFLWELTTLAQQPYINVDPFEITAYLKNGYRLTQPINCPDELYALMNCCWTINMEDRPTLLQLNMCLQDFSNELNKYV